MSSRSRSDYIPSLRRKGLRRTVCCLGMLDTILSSRQTLLYLRRPYVESAWQRMDRASTHDTTPARHLMAPRCTLMTLVPGVRPSISQLEQHSRKLQGICNCRRSRFKQQSSARDRPATAVHSKWRGAAASSISRTEMLCHLVWKISEPTP